MMKRVVGGLVAGAVLLGAVALAQGGVQLPPAEEEIAAMQSAFNQVSAFFAGLITEIKGAVATLNAVDADLAAKYRAVAAQLRDAEGKIRELQALAANIPGLVSGLEAARAQIADLLLAVEGLKKTDQELAAGLTALARNLEGTRQDLAAAIATLSEKVSDLAKQGVAYGNRITALEGAVLALKSAVEGCEASLRAEIEGLAGRTGEQILGIQASLAQINRQLSDHAGRIAALEAQDIGSMQRRILALEQAVQALNIKIENNREKIAYLEKAIGGFTADLKTTIGALQAKVDDHGTRLEAAETSVTTLQTDVQALKDGLALAQGLAIVALLVGLAGLVLGLLGG